MFSHQDEFNLARDEAKSKLLLIDFDLTITSEHIHNKISKSNIKNPDKQWDRVKGILPRGSAKDWSFIIKTAIENDYGVGIVSFNGYEHIVKRYLKEIIFGGKDLHLLQHIYIKCSFPSDYDPSTSNKNNYIQEAKIFFDFKGNNKDIIFVDDGLKNIEAAKKEGYQTIFANNSDHNCSFLDDLMIEVHIFASPILVEGTNSPSIDNGSTDLDNGTTNTAKNEEKSIVSTERNQQFKVKTKMSAQTRKTLHEEKNMLLPSEENTSVTFRKKENLFSPSLFSTRLQNTSTVQITPRDEITHPVITFVKNAFAFLGMENKSISPSKKTIAPCISITIDILKSTMEVAMQQSWEISIDNVFICSSPMDASELIDKKLRFIEFFKKLGIDVADEINKGKNIDIVTIDGTENILHLHLMNEAERVSSKKIRVNASWLQDVIGMHRLKTIIDIFTDNRRKYLGYDRDRVLAQLIKIKADAYKELKEFKMKCLVLAQAERASNGGTNFNDGDGIARLPHDLLIHVAYFASGSLFSKNKRGAEQIYNQCLDINYKR
jgi:hypothetical protein